jgi:polysaccharide biosynthesis/export protein
MPNVMTRGSFQGDTSATRSIVNRQSAIGWAMRAWSIPLTKPLIAVLLAVVGVVALGDRTDPLPAARQTSRDAPRRGAPAGRQSSRDTPSRGAPAGRCGDRAFSATECRSYRANIKLCQALGPAAPYPILGLDCASGACGELGWNAARPIDWQRFAQGEYVGHSRSAHLDHYRLRVDDVIDFVFRLTRRPTARAYRLQVGDRVRIESLGHEEFTTTAIIQPDGSITVRLLGQVRAARATVDQLRKVLEDRLREYYKQPAITVTPLALNSRLEDLRMSVDRRFGSGGQIRRTKVTPAGTVQLPIVHSVYVQGLTLAEAQREIEARFGETVAGVEIVPILVQRAPRYVYVLGEVKDAGRYELSGPTTVTQAIATAGGWNYGGNLWMVVVFRRADDWRLIATAVDLRGSLYGYRPCPADEIWLNDSDIVLVPKSAALVAANVFDLVFLRAIFRVARYSTGVGFSETRFSGTFPSLPLLPAIVIPHPTPTAPTLIPPLPGQ